MKVTSVAFIIAAITNSAQASGVVRMTKVAKAELRSKTTGQKEASLLSKTPKVGATKAARISKATKGTPGTIAKASKTTAKASKIGQKAEKKKIGKASKIGKAQPSDPIDPVNPPETKVPTSKPTKDESVSAGGTPKTSSPTESSAATKEPSSQVR